MSNKLSLLEEASGKLVEKIASKLKGVVGVINDSPDSDIREIQMAPGETIHFQNNKREIVIVQHGNVEVESSSERKSPVIDSKNLFYIRAITAASIIILSLNN
jgi:redox-sensitive bicupin YhaK (pirin superfamily)